MFMHSFGRALRYAQAATVAISVLSQTYERGPMTDSAPQTFKAHNVGDLFAMLPALFGFHPHESLVAITTYGERHRLGFRLRLDIPAASDVEDVAQQVAGYVRAQNPEGLLLLAVSAHAEPVGALVRQLRQELSDLPVIEAARGDGQRYWSYLCDNQECCPSTGTRYDGQCSEVVADAVYRGTTILPDREALVRRFDGPSGKRKKTMKALTARAARAIDQERRALDPVAFSRIGIQRLSAIFDRLDNHADRSELSQALPTDEEMALIMVWCSVILVRDDLWSQFSRETADAWLALLTHIAQSAVKPFEPAVLSLAAFAAWLTGDGAQAMIAVERALGAKPEYSMAHLVADIIGAGINPEVWTGFGPTAIDGAA